MNSGGSHKSLYDGYVKITDSGIRYSSDGKTIIFFNFPIYSENLSRIWYDVKLKEITLTFKNAYNKGQIAMYEYPASLSTFWLFVNSRHFTKEHIISLLGSGSRRL